MQLFSWLTLKVIGIKLNIKHLDSHSVDYSYYLGPNYREEYKPPNKGGIISTMIAPHVSCFDIQALATTFKGNITFAAGSFMKKVPILGGICKLLGCVFIPRSGSKTELNNTLDVLVDRAKLNEEEGTFPPTLIFPEGTTSNNLCLLKFRRGAFVPLRQVIPVTLKYNFETVSPAIEVLDEYVTVLLMCMTL